MDSHEIGKGVNLHIIPTAKFKSINISILIRQPLQRETVTLNALISQILQRGSAKYSDMTKIKTKTEELFGSIFEVQVIKKGEQQIIQFFMEFVNRKERKGLIDECLAFLKEVMLNPLIETDGFKREYVENEKENLKFAIESRMNNKAEYAKLRCVSEMCKDEPFGLYGDGYSEDLEGLNAKNCYEQYTKLLKEAPIDFVVIGDVDERELQEKINQLFVFERSDISDIPLPELNYEPREAHRIDEQMGLTQGKICIGLRSGVAPVGDDFYKLLLTNEIFGGGSNSKLFMSIREKESLCYYVSSFVYRFKSIILIQSGVDADNFQKVLDLTNEELKKMVEGQVTDEELENAKKNLVKKFDGAKDYPSATMDFYISQYMFKDPDTFDDVIGKVKKVNKEDTQQMAQKLYVDTIYCLS